MIIASKMLTTNNENGMRDVGVVPTGQVIMEPHIIKNRAKFENKNGESKPNNSVRSTLESNIISDKVTF